MPVLDGATSLSSAINEEAQRWVKATNAETAHSKPTFPESPSTQAASMSSVNKDPPEASPPHLPPQSVTLQQDRNTFEESFAAALTRPQITYDGHIDSECDDQTPLLGAYYDSTSDNNRASSHPSHHAPLEPPSKSKPSLSICLWHEVCHNSQYTRPAAEILREVLEARYPVASNAGNEDKATQGLVSGEGRSPRRRCWNREIRRCARA